MKPIVSLSLMLAAMLSVKTARADEMAAANSAAENDEIDRPYPAGPDDVVPESEAEQGE